jgi:hypothetical protein
MDEWKEVRKGTGRDVDLTRKDECLVVHGKGEVALQCLGRDLVLSGPQTWKLVNFQVPRFTRSQCSVDGQSTGTDWTDRVDGRQEQSTKSVPASNPEQEGAAKGQKVFTRHMQSPWTAS